MWKRIAQQPGLRQIPEMGEGATYLRKWGLIGILIGVGAGLGALALIWCIKLVNHFVLGTLVGYIPPLPGGEGRVSQYSFYMSRPWMLPLATTAAGLAGGFLTWKFAPQTAGIGTNAAIRAFHNSEKLSFKTSIFKLITSAITIAHLLQSQKLNP
jgi:CIC family chloride channel protein